VASKDDRRTSKKLTRTEIMALIGGALLAVSLFLPWYDVEAPNGSIPGVGGPGTYTAWEVHDIQRWLLLAAAASPFILAYIIVRGHQLSWARGEMTAVVAIATFGFVVYDGLISKPGDPRSLTSLEWGWIVAVVGTILMLVGSALRASEVERARKPPGVL
jgi:hypothetical protein